MSITLTTFAIILTILIACNILFTEAIKIAYKKGNKEYSANLIALISAMVIGGIGSIITYIFLGIAFDLSGIVCIPLFIIVIWVGSMVGFDKIFQLIEQIKEII